MHEMSDILSGAQIFVTSNTMKTPDSPYSHSRPLARARWTSIPRLRAFGRVLVTMAVVSMVGCATQGRAPSSAQLAQQSVERRAVEAAIWGMPTVNFDAMRQAYFRDAGARYNDLMYWSKPSDWKNQVTTPNNSNLYAMFFANLKDGPVVVDIPPVDDTALFGSLIDAWNVPMMDVGDDGQDKGKGGKYLLLPPGWKEPAPAGYFAVPSKTFNVYSLLRATPRSAATEDITKANALIQKLKVYPLAAAAQRVPARFIDMADKHYEAIAPYDEKFYDLLARMVAEEPTRTEDLAIAAQLHSMGIGKDVAFRQDAAMAPTLARSAAQAHAFMADGLRRAGDPFWPHRQWRRFAGPDVIKSRLSFQLDNRFLVDERAFTFFGAFGAPRNPAPNLYVKAFEDAQGRALDGSNTYRLHVPANVPATQFWAVNAYDSQSAGFLREAAVVGLDSYNKQLQRNADGSVDLYFAPNAPAGHEANWISTIKGKGFFLVFRIYVPERSVFAKTSNWSLDDVERLN